MNEVPQSNPQPKFDLTNKIAVALLIIVGINAVTFLTIRPNASRVSSVVEQVNFTLRMMPKFFGR
jgi:hypothetical protein